MIVLVLLVIGIVGLLMIRRGTHEGLDRLIVIEGDHIAVADTKRQLRGALHRFPAETVYTTTKDQIVEQPYGIQHISLHVFGEALYERNGVAGLAACDASYGFGCYHGFFGTAIASEGPEIIDDLDEACVAEYGEGGLGCQHGIGHGLGEYYGPGRLYEQLTMCSKLRWKGTLFGCRGGVFMEYNFPTMIDDSQATNNIRPFDVDHPYTPCDDTDPIHAPSCYFELAAWLLEAHEFDVASVDTLCSGISESTYLKECYRGLGLAIVARHQYSLGMTEASCLLIQHPDHQTMCLAGAAWAFFAEPSMSSMAGDVCGRLEEPRRGQCVVMQDLLAQ